MIQAAEQDRPDVRAKRSAWAEKVPGLDPQKLVFIDETGANTKMSRRYGRAPRGQRVIGRVPHGHWKTTTFVGALRSEGLVAPMVIDGAMNGDLFVAYVRQMLVPTLRTARSRSKAASRSASDSGTRSSFSSSDRNGTPSSQARWACSCTIR